MLILFTKAFSMFPLQYTVSLASARGFRAAILLMPGCIAAGLIPGLSAAQNAQPGPLAATPLTQAVAATQRQAVVAPSLAATNPFDKERQVWPDRIPPPPPPAPPPAPPAVTDQDMQVYGVIITGESRRATVKVGKRFAHLATSGRPFANVTEGQTLGEFILSSVRPDHLVLFAPGGEQRLYFTPKTDRTASPTALIAAAPTPVQGATNPQADAAGASGAAPAPAQGVQPAAAPVTGTPAANGVQQGTAPTPAPAPVGAANPFNLRNSLAAAMEAARNNASQQGSSPGSNPFQKP